MLPWSLEHRAWVWVTREPPSALLPEPAVWGWCGACTRSSRGGPTRPGAGSHSQ